MDMKIPEFGSLQMTRTSSSHFGSSSLSPVASVNPIANEGKSTAIKATKSFESYLLDAMTEMNQQQVDVTNVQQQLITDPDSVDIHDVTTAMAKAQMSLSLAQTVVDRLVSGWNEVTTMR